MSELEKDVADAGPASAPASQKTPRSGRTSTLIGRYAIRSLIGEGAMGRVLLAHDPVLDRAVALKHLRRDLAIPTDVREGLEARMRHEARAAARVSHPNLVVLHDMGEDPEVGLFLVFEYVEGPTLKAQLLKGRLSPPEVARLARELGAALTLAHDAGIVHRDIKPENVILASTGAKIADFGIARVPDSTLTHQGGLMGTPAYSAPETFRDGSFSPASDQFSLATMVFEALSGKRAFPGDDAAHVAAKIGNEEAPPCAQLLGLAASVDDALAKGMAKAPEARHATCLAFGERLAEALAEPRTPTRFEVEAAPPRGRKLGQMTLGAAVVVATVVLLVRAGLRSIDHARDADVSVDKSLELERARQVLPPSASAQTDAPPIDSSSARGHAEPKRKRKASTDTPTPTTDGTSKATAPSAASPALEAPAKAPEMDPAAPKAPTPPDPP